MKKIFIFIVASLFIAGIGLYIWLGYEMDKAGENIAQGEHEYVIILGAKVKPGGVPSLSLKNRLDVAAVYLAEHPHITAIVSGGQGHDEDRTEASVMSDYLIDKGIDTARIIEEDESTSTYENLLYSKELLPQNTNAVTIISNDFHLRRATFFAAQLDLQTDVIPAQTPASVQVKSQLRERAALLKAFLLNY
ncbi:MAG: YdcF family protein [Solibacillus sp.]